MLTRDIIDEYRTLDRIDISDHIKYGNVNKNKLRPVSTPLSQFDVRYEKDGKFHDYYLYSQQSGQCVGLFSIEEYPYKFKIVKPGIRAVTPHMLLVPEMQRKGISSQAYTTFLRGGPWVFVTSEHTKGAAKLWDSLAAADIVSFYIDEETGEVVKFPGYHDYRVLGPKSRFNI